MSKFDSDLDELIYVATLDGGADEEVGSVEDFGWHGLMRFSPDESSDLQSLAEQEGLELSEEDVETITTSAGAILVEDSQGFVDVTFYPDKEKLEAAWSDIQAEAEEFYGEGEPEEEEEEEQHEEA